MGELTSNALHPVQDTRPIQESPEGAKDGNA
jgi:hypothetical protein